MSGINLCISGDVFDKDKEGLSQFWKGFIAIQRVLPPSLPIHVYAHSSAVTSEELIKKVYGKDLKRLHLSDCQADSSLDELLKSEKFSAENQNQLFENYNALSSRARVINDLASDASGDELVFMTNWKAEFDKPVLIDASLPKEYIYFQYADLVDYGYSENWVLTSCSKLSALAQLPAFYLTSIANYIETSPEKVEDTFPLFIKKTRLGDSVNTARIGILKQVDGIVTRLTSLCTGTIFYNKVFGLGLRVKNAIKRPNTTGENTFNVPTSFNFKPTLSQLSHRGAVLKGYAISKGLRENVRFIDDGDFLSDHKGSAINPVSYCFVIVTHSDKKQYWQMLVSSAEKALGDECQNIVVYAEEGADTATTFESLVKSDKVSLLTYSGALKQQTALDVLLKSGSLPDDYVYTSFDNQPLVGRIDTVLLNSLLHHLSVNNNVKIDLVDSYDSNLSQTSDFPELNVSNEPSKRCLNPAIYNLARYRNARTDTTNSGTTQTNVDNTFYLIGDRKVNNTYSVNMGFPHLLIDEMGESANKNWLKELSALEEEFELKIAPETAIE
ncbi:hypothetical protein [Grimontia sp. NTOU-MAR1]|uniref:hypothetical protein n=1 Tax=Grimontia sp. NTOU-MAR1 TaxID=3111011 RepID=UPI002DB5AB78|nr:hypothetical protein [Grimontia sp. NTOU-MAR1]WRV97511.1 hypothetical protein VP504_15955 [Grimontia sp. NTOU-MAR1]